MTSAAHRLPVRLAHQALVQAIGGQSEKVAATLNRLVNECGGPGVYLALQAWCDAYADHMSNGENIRPADIQIATFDPEAGEIPPHALWAAQIVEARAQFDQERFDRLVSELPEGDYESGFTRGKYVMQVLESVALTIRTLPRGSALAAPDRATP